MFRRISKLIVLRRKRRTLGRVVSSLRSRQFERLECRSMLSASLGTSPGASSEYALDKYEYGGPLRENDDVYAPLSQVAAGDGLIPRGDELYYAHLDSINPYHPAYNSIGDGRGAWALGGPWGSPSPSVSVNASASPNQPAVASTVASPMLVLVYVNNYEPYFESYSPSPPPLQPSVARATAPPPFSSDQPQSKAMQNISKTSNGLYLSNVSAAATSAAIPSAAQIIARFSDKVSLVPNTAIDAALQSYSPHLLMAMNNSTTDRALPATTSENTLLSDNSFDDFMELSKSSSVQTSESTAGGSSVGAYDAANSVLEHLQELEMAPWQTNALDSQVAKDATYDSASDDTPIALALADFALANAEGGMVMLEFNNGQSSDVDFSMIAESGLVTPASHANFDSAVGFYQAIEVAGEEAPVAIRTTATAPVQSVKQSRGENRLSTESERPISGKAAAVAGVSALIGAGVWCAQRKQSDNESAKNGDSTPVRRSRQAP